MESIRDAEELVKQILWERYGIAMLDDGQLAIPLQSDDPWNDVAKARLTIRPLN